MPKKIKTCNDFALHDNERRIFLDKILVSNIHLKTHLSNKIVKNIILKIRSNKPAGLFHVLILSKILKRPINIYENNQLVYIFGKKNGKVAINAMFKNSIQSSNSLNIGHWTYENGNNPLLKNCNECLYQVISLQTGISARELKSKIMRFLLRKQKIMKLIMESVDPKKMINFMLGGARYGRSTQNGAKSILDNSQNGSSHPDGRSGHPRGHASYPFGNGSEDSVENYSYSRWRSGFLSREDQDLMAHYALITNKAKDIMEILNRGDIKVATNISRSELDYDPLPQAQIWNQGQRQGVPNDFRTICLVGKHFLNQINNPNADIFILTFYPIL